VLSGQQVLVCADCQTPGWQDMLDHCADCGSAVLVRRLGETGCRACGAVDRVAPGTGYAAGPRADRAALADEVAAAVDRVLRGD
jgi:uncharacterized Zn finger protein (UPF0148 family)